jgi:hypothetical protein
LHFCSAGLDLSQQHKFLAALKPASFHGGDYIVRQGDPGDMLYIITDGEVVVTRNVAPDAPPPAAMSALTADGKELVVTHLYEGHFFGETSLVQDAPRNANVRVAQGDVRCMCMSKEAFRPFLEQVRAGVRIQFTSSGSGSDSGSRQRPPIPQPSSSPPASNLAPTPPPALPRHRACRTPSSVT